MLISEIGNSSCIGAWLVGPVAQAPKKLIVKSVALNKCQETKQERVSTKQGNKEAEQAHEDRKLQIIKMGTRSADHSRTRNTAHRTCKIKESRNRESVSIASKREVTSGRSTR